MDNIEVVDFAMAHNDDTAQHKSKSSSLSPPLRNFDQSIKESQTIKSTSQRSGNCGAQDLHEFQSSQIKDLPSQHLKLTTEVVSSTACTVSEDEEDTATIPAFEYPIDYSKKQVSSNESQTLSMKSPGINEETTLFQETVLNLSKEVTYSSAVHLNSLPDPSALFLQSNNSSPSLMTGKSVNTESTSPLPLPSLQFGPSFSPITNQTVPGTNMMIPLPYENLSPTLFSGHNFPTLGQGSPNPLSSLVPSLQLPILSQVSQKPKGTRPFKAYPKDPLSLPALGLYALGSGGTLTTTSEGSISQQTNKAYTDFRKRMLASSYIGRCKRITMDTDGNMARNNSSPYTLPSPSMSLSSSNGTDEVSSDDGTSEMSDRNQFEKGNNQLKDEAYWERRRKNNLAAKRSRDARRAKEDEIAIRAAFLEQENLKLRFEVCALKNETAKLRCMLYS